MYKKVINYVDFDGNERSEEFYFNLTKAEIQKMAYSVEGGLDKLIRKIIETRDYNRLIQLIEDLIARSYGEKSLDGRRFEKSPEILSRFMQTNAYSDLYMELSGDDKKLLEFCKGIIPSDVAVEIERGMSDGTIKLPQ